MSEKETPSEALAAATERRIKLKTAVSNVERAAASASARPSWREDLLRELYILRVALDQHVEEVEGADGLLAEIRQTAPRLGYKIDRVRDEHPDLCRQTAETIDLCEQTADVDAIRAAVLDVLFALVRHRQRGADLVYEGYNVDIGGS